MALELTRPGREDVPGGSPSRSGHADVAAICPREDRTADRLVFIGFSADVAKNVMARACKAAGIAHRHPHDFRHRFASVKITEGVPVTDLAAQLGHAKKSLTLDVYSHVLLGEGVGSAR